MLLIVQFINKLKTYITECYDIILQNGSTEEEAIEFAELFDFSECEIQEENLPYRKWVTTIKGVEVWYDYCADYYFFCPVKE